MNTQQETNTVKVDSLLELPLSLHQSFFVLIPQPNLRVVKKKEVITLR